MAITSWLEELSTTATARSSEPGSDVHGVETWKDLDLILASLVEDLSNGKHPAGFFGPAAAGAVGLLITAERMAHWHHH